MRKTGRFRLEERDLPDLHPPDNENGLPGLAKGAGRLSRSGFASFPAGDRIVR
jgi:hypothetical protein